jgi:RecA/RadA recombinase
MNREIIQAQLDLYMQGRQQALEALEKARADVNAFNGAIEACNVLMTIEGGLERGSNEETKQEVDNERPVEGTR